MKKTTIIFLTTFFLTCTNLYAQENSKNVLESTKCKDKFSIKNFFKPGKNCKKHEKIFKSSAKEVPAIKEKEIIEKKVSNVKCKDKFSIKNAFKPGKNCKKNQVSNSDSNTSQAKIQKKTTSSSLSNTDITMYSGTFDVIDKEGDDKTSLFGLEHRNPNLFRNTFLGKFSPLSGAFVTKNSSLYLYTGIEGHYGIGPLKILPSFSPGYYQKGDGKDLGSVLEFKSEIKLAFDIFENSKIGYSYSHISNNDWGETNPGTDNQQITFSKNF